mmetsp:Transcript_174943/g.560994  ORF Transcript_174943/g.560994 Transcript_174943/m.560994 type:complete len:95 (-) Transcript_174943:934-1218(-)
MACRQHRLPNGGTKVGLAEAMLLVRLEEVFHGLHLVQLGLPLAAWLGIRGPARPSGELGGDAGSAELPLAWRAVRLRWTSAPRASAARIRTGPR